MSLCHAFQRKAGYLFNDEVLLRQALTHKSYTLEHNERLEFLGDAVLGLVVSHWLYQRFLDYDEGMMSLAKSHLVSKKCLYEWAKRLQIAPLLRLNQETHQESPAVLAGVMEAIIGAIFLESGLASAQSFIETHLQTRLDDLDLDAIKSPKNVLQEKMQQSNRCLPVYTIEKVSGPPHAQRFEVSCLLTDVNLTTRGSASSRKEAERIAALAMLKALS